MKKMMKLGFAALAVAAMMSARAAEAEAETTESEYDAIGWTPIAVGIASPVQLPWGSHTWDVFGLNLGILWTDAPKMYGLDITGIASASRCAMKGIKISGLCNWNTADVYGMRVTLGGTLAWGETYGIDVGAFGFRNEMWGWDTEFLGSYQDEIHGLQIGGLANVSMVQSYGATIAIGGNWAKTAYGLQLGAVFNFTDELHGCQIGLVNFARECPWGFQIGLVNIILDNKLKVLPLINCYF